MSTGQGWREEDRGPLWVVGIAGMALIFWGLLDITGVRGERVQEAAAEPAAQRMGAGTGSAALEPDVARFDADETPGTVIRLEGIVVGAALAEGFWVRDARDNILFVVQPAGPGEMRTPAPGSAIRVLGTLVPTTSAEHRDYLSGAGLVLPASARVIRNLKLAPLPGGMLPF